MPQDLTSLTGILGLASAILSVAALVPYLLDVVRGRTQPKRASWLIWSIISAISFASLVYEGATDSLWFVGAQASGTATVFFLSVGMGRGEYLSRTDMGVLACAAVGIVLWLSTENAAWSLAMNIAVSSLGGSVTVAKAYRRPASETMSTWLLLATAAALSVASVGSLDWVLLAYPLYLFALYTAIVAAMLLGRTSVARPGT